MEVAGGWNSLHNKGLHNTDASQNIIRVIKSTRKRWAAHVARMGEMRNAYSILVGKAAGKRPLWRPRLIWKALREIGWKCGDWIYVAQDRDQWRPL
jgi:hypothetical protein